MKNSFLLMQIFTFFFAFLVLGVPNYIYYGTYSVELYNTYPATPDEGNGCQPPTYEVRHCSHPDYINDPDLPTWCPDCNCIGSRQYQPVLIGGWDADLEYSHEMSSSFSEAIQQRAGNRTYLSYFYNREDKDCYSYRWASDYAEINMLEFAVFSGHGNPYGPFFGCAPEYHDYQGKKLNSIDHLRFGAGDGYLDWVIGNACSWLKYSADGKNVFTRWTNSFKGVHSVMSYSSIGWQTQRVAGETPGESSLADEFWKYWIDEKREIHSAWKSANFQAMWEAGDANIVGIEPAVLSANTSYRAEKWATATNNPAPHGAGNWTYVTYGQPQY